MTIQQVQYLSRPNYVRPMSDEDYGYKLFCEGGSLPVDCSKEMLRGWVRAWRKSEPFNFDRNPALKNVEPAEYRSDYVGA
jgi:hypothetical protein